MVTFLKGEVTGLHSRPQSLDLEMTMVGVTHEAQEGDWVERKLSIPDTASNLWSPSIAAEHFCAGLILDGNSKLSYVFATKFYQPIELMNLLSR